MDKAFYESEIDALQKQVLAAQSVAIERGDALIRAHAELRRLNAELTAEVAKNSNGAWRLGVLLKNAAKTREDLAERIVGTDRFGGLGS